MAKVLEETRYWCEYCRIFVYNNRINREKHDYSPQHQANFKKKIDLIRREEKEREKLQLKPLQPSSKLNSVYNTSSAKTQETSTPVTNILNVKANAAAPKKKVIGLASEKEKPGVPNTYVSAVVQNNSLDYNVDITASSGDLKRKILDEIALQSFSCQSHTDAQAQEEIDISGMFKKKKKASQ